MGWNEGVLKWPGSVALSIRAFYHGLCLKGKPWSMVTPPPFKDVSNISLNKQESGKPVNKGWKSVVVLGQFRRFCLVVFVRLQAVCLPARMGHLDLGAA